MDTTVVLALHQSLHDVDDDGWADLPGHRRMVVRPRLFWNEGAGRSLFLTVGGTAESREGGTLDGGTTPEGSAYAESLETRRADVGLVGRALLGGNRLLSVRASPMGQGHDHRFGDRRERDRHTTAFGELSVTGRTFNAGVRLDLPLRSRSER